MMIYRCWKIYNKSIKVIALPMLLWPGGVVAPCIWMTCITLSTGISTAKISSIFWAFSVAINIYTTSCIVYRLLIIDRILIIRVPLSSQVRQIVSKTASLRNKVVSIIVESAFMYTSLTTVVLISLSTSNNGKLVYISTAADVMFAGICFDMIIIRIHQEFVKDVIESREGAPTSSIKFEVAHTNIQTTDLETHVVGV
ncbi:hypothetical protein CPB83DRAFT_285071 [Crepidotus variabilis]|uniref:Uncharacterized protein n=1 Tax=Crepidotus variabilis TaxID=179855 RepID=A0A9P6JQF0_9AGAR|nr:hypothetical protein CPB83DRAFT_285071 [Crepidotus variabilis]